MQDHSPSSHLLSYWQQEFWRTIFNELPIAKANFDKQIWHIISLEDLGQGTVNSLSDQEGNIWIAPIVCETQTDKDYWIPLWIPALLKENSLTVNQEALPWIPPSLFNLNAQTPFSTQLYDFDDWLRFECLDEEGKMNLNWNELYSKCLSLFHQFCDGLWLERAKELNLSILPQGLVLFESTLQKLQPINITSELLANYTQIEDPQPKLQLDSHALLKQSFLFSGSVNDAINVDRSTYEALIHALVLQEGELLAIKTPLGSSKDELISTIAASKSVNSALEDKPAPDIFVLGKEAPCVCDVDKLEELSSKEIKQRLQNEHNNLLKAIELATSYCSFDQSQEEELESLKQQDEYFETQFVFLTNLQDKIQKQSQNRSFWQLLRTKKKWTTDEIQQLNLSFGETYFTSDQDMMHQISEKIRQIKVSRTKIHQALVEIVERLALKNKTMREWQDWLAHNVPEIKDTYQAIEDLLPRAQKLLSFKLFKLAKQYFAQILFSNDRQEYAQENAQSKLPKGYNLFKWHMGKVSTWEIVERIPDKMDFLMIDQSNQLLPQQMMFCLSKAKCALFLGDIHDYQPQPALSTFTEEQLLKNHSLDDEELIEQLHYKNMLMSKGNAMGQALANSTYQQYLDTGIFATTFILREIKHTGKITAFLNDHYYQKSLKICHAQPSSLISGFNLLPVNGQSTLLGRQMSNLQEAQAIINWLQNNTTLFEKVILTPFYAQQQLLTNLLKEKEIDCQAYTLHDVPFQLWQSVIFSCVYCPQDQRPFLFDQDEWFYRVIARAKESIWIFGHPDLFNHNMHSPSGNIAKVLQKQQCQAEIKTTEFA